MENEMMNPFMIMFYGFSWGMAVALFMAPLSVLFYLERMFNKRMARRQNMLDNGVIHQTGGVTKDPGLRDGEVAIVASAPSTPPPPRK